MEEHETKAIYDAFLNANANEEFIASKLADVIRYSMRAVSSDVRTGTGYSAAETMSLVIRLIARSEQPQLWPRLFSLALEELREGVPQTEYEQGFVDAARRGIKYLVEISAMDGAARGRASRRRNEFKSAMESAIGRRQSY